jgi:hypothetical protein
MNQLLTPCQREKLIHPRWAREAAWRVSEVANGLLGFNMKLPYYDAFRKGEDDSECSTEIDEDARDVACVADLDTGSAGVAHGNALREKLLEYEFTMSEAARDEIPLPSWFPEEASDGDECHTWSEDEVWTS